MRRAADVSVVEAQESELLYRLNIQHDALRGIEYVLGAFIECELRPTADLVTGIRALVVTLAQEADAIVTLADTIQLAQGYRVGGAQ